MGPRTENHLRLASPQPGQNRAAVHQVSRCAPFRPRRHWLAVPTLRLAGDSQTRDGGIVQHANVQTTELY
jgi:hypothetical protein